MTLTNGRVVHDEIAAGHGEAERSWSPTTRVDEGKEGADPGLMRELNRAIVLNFIRQENSISRADIAARTKLSRSAVSNIIASLIEEGIVQESGIGESKGGRRPIMVNFNYAAAHVIGLDLGVNHLLAVLTDLDGTVVRELSRPFSLDDGPQAALPAVLAVVEELIASVDARKRVLGLGVGVPGPLNQTTGVVVAPPIMPGWDQYPIRQRLQAELGLPVYADNDANLGAIAERWRGKGQGQQHLAYVIVGSGIGCGLIVDGKIYRGNGGSAGEIGHLTISRDGPPCRCGSYGCLESMAAGPAIVNRVRLAVTAGRKTSLSHHDPFSLTAQDVVRASEAGDQLAIEILSDAGRYIGIALANLVNLFNPGVIIIGGGVAAANSVMMAQIHDTVRQRSLIAAYDDTIITTSDLGRGSVALGAAVSVLQEIFRGPDLIAHR